MKNSIFSKFDPQALKKYAGNTSWLLFEKVVRMLAGFVIGLYIARYLGPIRLGLLHYDLSYVFLVSVLSSLGMNEILTRELVHSPDEEHKILGTAFSMRLGAATIVSLGLFLSVFITQDKPYERALLFLLCFSPFFSMGDIIPFYFQAKVQAKHIAQVQILTIVLASVLKIWGVYKEYGLLYFGFLSLLEMSVLPFVGYMYSYAKKSPYFSKWTYDTQTASSLLKHSLPLLFSGIVANVYARIDQIMIKELLGDKETGLYVAAVKISEMWHFFPMVICSSLFPALIHAKDKGEEHYTKRLQQLIDLVYLLSLGIVIPVFIFAPWGMEWMYGSKYLGSEKVLQIHIWGGIFMALGVASGKWMIQEQLTALIFKRAVLGCILNISLNFYLIPKLGIQGAAWATLISLAGSQYFADLLNTKTLQLFKQKTASLLFISAVRQALHQVSKLTNK